MKCKKCGKLLLYAHNPIMFGKERLCPDYHPDCMEEILEEMLKMDSQFLNKEKQDG